MEHVNDYAEKMCEISNTSGISIAVLDNGNESYINVGYANKKRKEEVSSNTRHKLGSTTKAFTDLGILLLEQLEKIV